ncbi:MAG: hypothetical protein A2W29_13465 [Gemmatimonadetes bacterium RBG_16_66_8]|nr:MAG: hypothetical protein A2W29_13465 [Gemmatimonadetes bacterium RBG_16_66_8]
MMNVSITSRSRVRAGIGWIRVLSAAFLCVLAASCAPSLKTVRVPSNAVADEARVQRELSLRTLADHWQRSARIHYTIVRNAGTLGGKKSRQDFGLTLHDLTFYPTPDRDIAAKLFGAGDRVTVRDVLPDSPAAAAGMRQGDTLVSINGTALGERHTAQAVELLKIPSEGPCTIEIQVLRAGRVRALRLTSTQVCDIPAFVVSSDAVNAYTDGSRVFVTTGMLNFAERDEDLALVVGHEIAHAALGHVTKRRVNSLLGSLVDAVVQVKTGFDTGGLGQRMGGIVFSRAFEAEADYLGAYLAARAGYDLHGAPQFWRKMSQDHPGSSRSNFFSTHPTSPERFVALERIVQEIRDKQERKLPLEPDRKSESASRE